jgi:reductive dehalogenase
MPESLTRREFMKELGKFGAVASLAPMVNLEEQASDKAVGLQRPSFIKTQDEPTSGVDWANVNRYAEFNTVRRGFTKYVGEDEANRLSELRAANLDKWLKEGKDGYTLLDRAMQSGAGSGGVPRSFIGPQKAKTPEDLGVPKWEGSPEEAAMVVTAALRHLGAATVGFVELDTNTTEKLIYSHDPDGVELRIEDAEQPEETEEYRLIPKKARWAVVYTVQMSEETMTRCPTPIGSMTTSLTYRRSQNIQERLQEFLRGLGYMGIGEASTNALGIAPAFGVMAGLGELSRLNRLVTPEYGPMVRVFKLLTDLPLAPTKPINAGIWDFCHDCLKCAEMCPPKNLSFGDATWEVRGGWNNPGHEAFFENSTACRSYWNQIGTNCGICFTVCPFSSKNLASFHRFRNSVAAKTRMFNKAFVSLDDLLYSPYRDQPETPQKSAASWWKQNLPDYGIDTYQTVRETS